MAEQRAWAVRVTVVADDTEIESVVDRVGRALCPGPGHPGPCRTPWGITYARVDDLDAEDRARWLPGVETLLEQRRAEDHE